MDAVVQRDATAHPDAWGRFPARQQQAVLLKVVYSRELRQLAEPAQLRAVKPELEDEWVSAAQVLRASLQMEYSEGRALAAWEQLLEP